MDPITATVVAGLLWFFLGGLGGGIVYLIFVGLGALVDNLTDNPVWLGAGVIIGWIASVLWSGFVLFQVIKTNSRYFAQA